MASSRGLSIAGVVSFYGPLDLSTLWQRDQLGKTTSPRGPLKFFMPWDLKGFTNCSDSFPAGGAWYYNVDDENDPRNDSHMLQLSEASPTYYANSSSSPHFLSQRAEDGMIGQYKSLSQASRMYTELGQRAKDRLIECPGRPDGYGFNDVCTVKVLRLWRCRTLQLSKC